MRRGCWAGAEAPLLFWGLQGNICVLALFIAGISCMAFSDYISGLLSICMHENWLQNLEAT